MEIPTRPRTFQIASLFAFGLSGFAALLYQIVWQRILVFFTGAGRVCVHASSWPRSWPGLGHWQSSWAGSWRTACRERTALTGFAAAELAIAAVQPCEPAALLQRAVPEPGNPCSWRTGLGAVLFISLLWPTFFMGVSLPLLAKAVTHHGRHGMRPGFGRL